MAATARIDELKKRYEENQRRFFAPLANEYRKAGDLEQAIALCRMHLADAPNNISGQIVFGQALYDAGTLDESRTVFETAIGLDPENLIALRHLGDIAKTQLDVPRAREWYQRVLDADRRNEEVLALMEELKALDAAVPEAPAPEAAPEPSPEAAPSAPTGASSPMSSSASLTGSDTPTLQIVAMSAPPAAAEPEPPPARPEPPAADLEELDFGEAETAPEPAAAESTPASSFGFDVDLDAASHIPTSENDESTSEFGVVELPSQSAFSDPVPPMEPAPFATHPDSVSAPAEAYSEAPAEAAAETFVEQSATIDVPALELPSVLEFVEAPPEPSVPVAAQSPAPASDDLLDFELESPPATSAAPEPAFEAFELTTTATPEFVAEPVAADTVVEDAFEPAPPRASLESFDPIREMPTPIAPMAAAPELTPAESAPAFVDETPVEMVMDPPAEMPVEAPVELVAEAPAATEAFATETMAELYVQQGLRQEAIGVYQQLIAARPDDASLRGRLAELTGEIRRPGGSTARAFFANLAGRRATPLRTSVIIDERVPMAPTPLSVPVVESAPPADPFAEAFAPEPAAEPMPELVPEFATEPSADYAAEPPLEYAAEAPVEYAAEAPIEGAGEAPTEYAAEPVEYAADAPTEYAPEPMVEAVAEETASSEVSTGGTLDALFGHSNVATPDNSAAQTLASAFTSKPTPPMGRPTRAANDEMSLDRVFREGAPTPSKGGLSVPRQSTSLRFDQFFTPPADPQGGAPASPPPASPGGESEQFQSWLSGLKKP